MTPLTMILQAVQKNSKKKRMVGISMSRSGARQRAPRITQFYPSPHDPGHFV